MGEKIGRHQMQEPPPVEVLRPDVPPLMAAVVRTLLEKRPQNRFQTPEQVAAALTTLLAGGTPTFPPRSSGRRWYRRSLPWVASFLGLALVVSLFWRPWETVAPTDPVPLPVAPAPVFDSGLPGWQPSNDSDAALKLVTERIDSTDNTALYQDLLDIGVRFPGSPAAFRAADLVMSLPSPLDKLDANKIPPEERFDFQPKELVAVLGKHRGSHDLQNWNVKVPAGTPPIKRHSAPIKCLALSHDSRRLLTVNSGPKRAAKYLQEAVMVDADGAIGPATLAAIGSARDAIDAVCDMRLAFLRGLATFGHFGKGWTARVATVRAKAKALAA